MDVTPQNPVADSRGKVRFFRLAAWFSIIAPVGAAIAVFLVYLTLKNPCDDSWFMQLLAPIEPFLFAIVSVLVISGFLSGFVSMIASLVSSRRGGFLGKAVAGTAVNGLLLIPTSIFIITSIMTFSEIEASHFTEITPEAQLQQALNSLDRSGSDLDRFYNLGRAAELSYKQGKINDAWLFSVWLLDLSAGYRRDWNYGNAIHEANNTLGLIALDRGDIEVAEYHLIQAGNTPGSPQLGSFGPSFSLAKRLLEVGKKDTVLQYLKLCRLFWGSDCGRIDGWIKEINAGKIPEF